MDATPLLSGLFGALISSALGYGIRVRLDRQNVIEAQRRIAYVHFVRISYLISLEGTIRSIVKVFGSDKLKEFEKEKKDKFGLSHAICAYVAKSFNEMKPETWNELSSSSVVVLFFKSCLDTIDESKLSPQELAELPRVTIREYSQYLTYLSWLSGCIKIWQAAFEQKSASWLTAENLHEQWRTVNLLLDSAKRLRVALIHAGAATAEEADTLLSKQMDVNTQTFIAKMKDKPMLLAATADLAKEDKPGK